MLAVIVREGASTCNHLVGERRDPVSETVPRRVTATDIARAAGVSRATVGFVVNGTQGQRISPATRWWFWQRRNIYGSKKKRCWKTGL